MIIKVLGPGCTNCKNLERVTRQAVDALGVDATIEKVTDYPTIVGYGVMATPPWSSTRNSCSPAGSPPPPRSANSSPRSQGRHPRTSDDRPDLSRLGATVSSSVGCQLSLRPIRYPAPIPVPSPIPMPWPSPRAPS